MVLGDYGPEYDDKGEMLFEGLPENHFCQNLSGKVVNLD
jgi:hypothetical protein